jgi:hypothetical protein
MVIVISITPMSSTAMADPNGQLRVWMNASTSALPTRNVRP